VKALLKFVGLEDPVLSKPFTVLDPQGSVWAIASDRIWFVAAKDKNTCPRYRGGAGSLNTILALLRAEPKEAVAFDREDVLRRIDTEGLGQVLGVTVSLKRLSDLLSFPVQHLKAWNATSVLGISSLGFDGEGWRAYLMGFDNVVGSIPTFSLVRQSLFEEIMRLDE
jgi:hypothetical protein